jgi:hypothetical protein
MTDATSSGRGVAQPAGLHLFDLNERSAKLGTWEVGCFHGQIKVWPYTNQKAQKVKYGAAFRCILVSISHPSQYVVAQLNMRGANKEPLDKAKVKFSDNKTFHLSKVRMHNNTQKQYLHTPCKFVVQIQGSSFDPLVGAKPGQTIQAEPAMDLSNIRDLTQHQRFDVTALVASVGEPHSAPTAAGDRCVIAVTIIDQSEPGSTVQELQWNYWMNAPPTAQERATINILQSCEGSDRPLSFFALAAKKTVAGFLIENTQEFFAIDARGPRAVALAAAATQMHAVPTASRTVIETAAAHTNWAWL